MAADTNVAVILISHPNKSSANADPMARVSGSGAFVALARSAWLVEKDPQDADGKRRLIVPLKNNIGDDQTGFAFRVEGTTVVDGIETSRVVFEPGTVTISAAELLQGQNQTDEERGQRQEAEEFLREYLKDGPMITTAVTKAAEGAGIARRTLERARASLNVRATKSKTAGNWVLSLPEQPRHSAKTATAKGGEFGGLDGDHCPNGEDRHFDPPFGEVGGFGIAPAVEH
jgi:hypothetical protein